MTLHFANEAIYWRGPAPFVFVPTPPEITAEIKTLSSNLSYGWGCIPVKAQIGETEFTTSLLPKEGSYYVPVKALVQRSEGVKVGETITVTLDF